MTIQNTHLIDIYYLQFNSQFQDTFNKHHHLLNFNLIKFHTSYLLSFNIILFSSIVPKTITI
jgi:hypothetical protein